MNLILKHKLIIAGAFLGAMGGYIYYHFIGCYTGSCAITSNPINSTLYGSVLGGLLFNVFKKENKQQQNDQ